MNDFVSLRKGSIGLSFYRTRKLLYLFFGALIITGALYAESIESFFAYLLVCAAVLWPLHLWVRMVVPGIPVLPAVALMHLQYYALPILRKNYSVYEFGPQNILTAAISVALYLVVMTAVWRMFVGRAKYRIATNSSTTIQNHREIMRLGMAGVWLGLFFQIALFYGFLSWTGSSFGVIRSLAFALTSVSCFFLAVAWGQGMLSNKYKRIFFVLLSLIVVLIWSSLFLVIGVLWICVAMLGYFIASRRIPLTLLILLSIAIFVLHSGKAEMRDKYWGGKAHISSIFQLPSFYKEWFTSGVSAVTSGGAAQNIFDRVSLLQMLLMAQERTPAQIKYLYGSTYAMLPALIVPRFLWPGKPVSQSALNMLNIRYGLVQLNEEGKISTAIGWGVIAESYVNFGMYGIVAIGIVMGTLIGLVSRWNMGKPAVSLPSLSAVAAMVAFLNLEVDFTYLCTILFQSFISVIIFYNVYLALIRRR